MATLDHNIILRGAVPEIYDPAVDQRQREEDAYKRQDQQIRLSELMQRGQDSRARAAEAQAQHQQAQQMKTLEAIGPIAAQALKLPPERRAAYIASAREQLGRFGVTDDHLMDFDPSDDNLGILAAFGNQAKEQGPSSLEREYDFLEGIEPGLGRTMAHNKANPTQWVRTEDDTGIHLTPVTPNGGPAPASAAGGRVRVNSKAEYDALPPGTRYTAPDGSAKIKGGASPAGSRTFP